MAGSLVVLVCAAEQVHETARTEMDPSVRRFLQTLSDNTTAQYIAVFRDLNGDGQDEALVHFISGNRCSSGGCDTLILSRNRGAWTIVTAVRLTGLPVRVLKRSSNGWRNIAVWVQGEGVQPGYDAEFHFDGKTYPINPSIPPALRMEYKVEIPAGVVIDGSEERTLLYGSRRIR